MTREAKIFQWVTVGLAIVCLIIVSIHMSWIDERHFKINNLTRSIKSRIQGAMRSLALDALLVE